MKRGAASGHLARCLLSAMTLFTNKQVMGSRSLGTETRRAREKDRCAAAKRTSAFAMAVRSCLRGAFAARAASAP
eukprot:15482137-Alexandrium_andersonii.AAC.1